MRSPAVLLALALASAAPASAAQRGGLSEYHPAPASGPAKTNEEIQAEARRAAGLRDVKGFEVANTPKPRRFPWLATGLAVVALLVASPFAYRMFKSTRSDLQDQATFGLSGARRGADEAPEEGAAAPARIARRPPARAAGETRIVKTPVAPGAEAKPPPSAPARARDRIWDAVTAANSWVSVEWVSTQSGLSSEVVADEIGALAQEGYLQQTRDRAGKPVFRVGS
jgi:hypothetical protein